MELTIEKLIYGGDGLARSPADTEGRRRATFVPLTLPGETVEARIAEEKPGFARAQLERVLIPSPDRIVPNCPYFGSCGGCHYQHTGYAHQLEFKKSILRETIERIAKIELPEIATHASPAWNYRNRTRFHVQHAPEFAIGYYRLGSRDLLPVRSCPISAKLIERALLAIWEFGEELPSEVVEIELFCNHEESQLMIEFWCAKPPGDLETRFQPIADRLQVSVPELASIAVLHRTARYTTDPEATAAPELDATGPAVSALGVFGDSALTYRVSDFDYRVSAGSFFQTNLFLAKKLIDLATHGATGKLALDLYSGVGLFSLPLAQSFERVVAVENAPSSSDDLRRNSPANVRAITASAEQFLSRKQSPSPDLVVVDPPRAGLGNKVATSLARLDAWEIRYLSCDPSTQARDLGPLLRAGYRIAESHLIDLFPQTYHIESLLRLVR